MFTDNLEYNFQTTVWLAKVKSSLVTKFQAVCYGLICNMNRKDSAELVKEMSYIVRKEEASRAISQCHKKVHEMSDKIIEFKKKIHYTKASKDNVQLRKHYKLLKKETENVENDVVFVRSLMEDGIDYPLSLTVRFMKKLLPRKYNERCISNEFKVSLMNHITLFLENKLNKLEAVGKALRKINKLSKYLNKVLVISL